MLALAHVKFKKTLKAHLHTKHQSISRSHNDSQRSRILCNLSKRIGDIHHFGPPKKHVCKTPGLVPAPSAVKPHLFVRRRKAKTSPGSTPSGKTITWWHRTVELLKNETRPPYLFSFRWGWCTLADVIWDSRERLLPGSHVMILPDLASLGCGIIGNHPPHSIPKLFNCSSEHSWASVWLDTFSQQNSYQKILRGSERKILGALNQPFSLVSPPNHIQLRCSGIKVAEMSGATKALNAR